MERALFRRLATTENPPREPWLSGEDVRCQPSLCIVSALGEARKKWETMHDEVWKTVPSLARAEVRRRATSLTAEKQKSTCRERRERPFFSSSLFLFLFVQARFRGPIKFRPKTPSASLPNKGKDSLQGPPTAWLGSVRTSPWPFYGPALFSIHRYLVSLSTSKHPQRTTPTTAPHTPPRALFIPANPPAPCRWAKRLSGPPKAYLEARPQGLLHRPLRPQQRRPLPTATATVHSRPPQSVPSQPVTPQFPSSSIASPTRPDHSCLPPVARRRLCSFRPSAKEPGEPSSRLGKPLFAAAALPFRPPSTAHRPSSGATLQPLPQPPTTATSTTPITPTTTTTPAKTCLQSTPHPHNGGENGALQAGGAG